MAVDDDLEYINNESNHLGNLVRRMTELVCTLVIALNATGLVTAINALPTNPKVSGLLFAISILFSLGLVWTIVAVFTATAWVVRLQNFWSELLKQFLDRKIDVKEMYYKYNAQGPKSRNVFWLNLPGAVTFTIGLTLGLIAIYIQYYACIK